MMYGNMKKPMPQQPVMGAQQRPQGAMAKGGMAKMKTGGGASSASKRADGVAKKGKTKGKLLAKGGMTKMRKGGAC